MEDKNASNGVYPKFNPDNVPEKLQHFRAFMGTRFEPKPGGKLDKPPYSVAGGRKPIKADPTNPDNWATFEEALAAYRRGDVDGIGFVFSEYDPFSVIDQDDVIDAATGETSARASEIVANFPTFWEVSTRGTGLHGICIADKPGSRCRRGNVEIYDGLSGARFMVITGHTIGPESDIRDCQRQIDALYKNTFEAEAKARHKSPPPPAPPGTRILEPEELIEKARNSRAGKKFTKLFDHGERSGYPGNSEADMALINMLAFWCAGDADYMAEMFRHSALYRPKDKHAGYVRISVNNCLRAYKGGFYTPKRVKEQPKQKQDDLLSPYLALLADPSQWKGQKEATAYKAYAALVIMALEDGISTGQRSSQDVLRIGADVRRLAERCGANRVTLQRSTLPYLWKERRLIEWRPGKGRQAGEFILKKPKLTLEATNKDEKSTVHTFIGSTWSESLNALAQLIRMRSGVSRTGEVRKPVKSAEDASREDRIRELGKFETVPRLGPVAMFCMVVLIGSKRGLPLEEIVRRTGRRKDNIRRVMRKLVDAEISEESHGDFFSLTPDFWKAYKKSLVKTGIRRAEVRQRRQHDRERRDRDVKLAGKKPKRFSPKVLDMDSKRREKEDREAKRRQFMEYQDEATLTPQQMEEELQEVLMDAYDEMVKRCMQSLGKRRDKGRGGA
jgi:hypothetical protein